MHLARAVFAAVVLAASPAVYAAPCAGFTDVEDTSTFCVNVTWMKNRGITLGCSSSTLYCPNDPVTRLAMAAFISRLDRVNAPTIVDSLGAALGPVVTFTEPLAQTYYRAGGDAYSIHLLSSPVSTYPPTFVLAHTQAYFAQPNCAGTAYGNTTLIGITIVGKLGLVVRGTSGSRLLFAVPVYPAPLNPVSLLSFLNNGVCTNSVQNFPAYTMTFVENLAQKYMEPFVVR